MYAPATKAAEAPVLPTISGKMYCGSWCWNASVRSMPISGRTWEGFQEEWLQCRRSDQERNIREDRKRVEQAKKRLADLDVLLSRLYEDFVLGYLSKEWYKKMTADYEAEQERLKTRN